MVVENPTILRPSNNQNSTNLEFLSPICFIVHIMNELVIEKLLEQRDAYLNILKQIDFQISIDSDVDLDKSEKLKTTTIEQIKKIEQEIAYINSKLNSQ